VREKGSYYENWGGRGRGLFARLRLTAERLAVLAVEKGGFAVCYRSKHSKNGEIEAGSPILSADRRRLPAAKLAFLSINEPRCPSPNGGNRKRRAEVKLRDKHSIPSRKSTRQGVNGKKGSFQFICGLDKGVVIPHRLKTPIRDDTPVRPVCSKAKED